MPATSKANYEEQDADPNLANGPVANRSCRDVLCCLFFLVFMAGSVAVAAYGYANGNPKLIGRGYDADGNMCGVDPGYEDYPYLYFPLPFTGYLTKTVCVASCPAAPLPNELVCHTNDAYKSCVQSTWVYNDVLDLLSNGTVMTGKFYIYNTTGYVSRFCIPQKVGDIFSSATGTVFNSDVLEQWVSDIRETWQIIAVSIAIAFVIGFVYMVLLRYCSGVLTWLAIIAFIAGMAILGWRFYDNAKNIEDNTESTNNSSDNSSSASKTILMQKIIAYICWGVAGLTVLVVLCLYSRIQLAIAILKAASDYVKQTPSIFLVPPVIVVLMVAYFVFWAAAAVFLVSSGTPVRIQELPLGSFEYDKQLKRLLIYHLFALLWFNAFVIAATQFIFASSTSIWYFSQGSGQGGASGSIRTSIYRFFRYHFGSIAFGSFILALIQLVRLILAYMQAQAQKLTDKEGKIIRFTLACLQCYVACFERFIKFLNKNAYIQIALGGKNFCFAAKDAFVLIINNPLRLGVVSSIGSIFVFFGKIFIGALTALAAFIAMTKWKRFSEQIYSPFIPTLIVFIFAYCIGAIFMTVYGLAADTILACFILDEKLSKQRNSAALHTPESLRDFVAKHKKN